MQDRIFLFTAISATLATWLLRVHIPAIDTRLAWLDIPVAIGGFEAVLGYVLPGILIGFVCSKMFKLHDLISDLLQIRENYDLTHILIPLAQGSGVSSEQLDESKLRERRRSIMKRVFYDYVSAHNPQIDRHLVWQALDRQSWFWGMVEALVVFFATGFTLVVVGAFKPGFWVLGGGLFAMLAVLPMLQHYAVRATRDEVEEILRDQARKAAIKGEFNAL